MKFFTTKWRSARRVVFLGLVLSCLGGGAGFGQATSETLSALWVLMRPTGRMQDGLPVMEPVAGESAAGKRWSELYNATFIREAVERYRLAQQYLKHHGAIKQVEPAYLALTRQEGGFAKQGFWLLLNGRPVAKRGVHYVDITEAMAMRPPDRLMSLTQLYPHELGHVILNLLTGVNPEAMPSRRIGTHYFSIVTDYATAFHEGFAEHFENAARLYEPDVALRQGILADAGRVRRRAASGAAGFTHDFRFPLRLNYYRAIMPVWFQQLETLKRFDWAMNGAAKFKAPALEISEPARAIAFRNTCAEADPRQLRTLAQGCATEGVVCAFFTQLIQSDLKNRYQPPSFYSPFGVVAGEGERAPERLMTPLCNLQLKVFHVIHQHVRFKDGGESQFYQFVSGYCQAFPEEAPEVKRIFKEATGHDISGAPPAEIWAMAKDVRYPAWIMDQFGRYPSPCYTFNINAADSIDLMMIKRVGRNDAEGLVREIQARGGIQRLEDVLGFKGISVNAAEWIAGSAFDQAYFKSIKNPRRNFMALLGTNLGHLLLRGLPHFAILMILVYLVCWRKQRPSLKALSLAALGKFFFTLLMIALGLTAAVLFPDPLVFCMPVFALLLALDALIHRKCRPRLKAALLTTLYLSGMVVYSLF